MKILNVNNTLDPVNGGGTAERTLQLSRALCALGAECAVLSLDIGVTDDVRRRAGKACVATVQCRLERYHVPSLSWKVISDLVSSADIIQLVGHWSPLNAFVFGHAVRYKKPYVVCPAGAVPIFGRSRLIKTVYDLAVGERMMRQANACIAITPREIPDLKGYGVREQNIFVIPNGIDPVDYTHSDDRGFREKFKLSDAPFILFIGRLNVIKGPDLLLEAFTRVVRTNNIPHHLVFVGPDSGMLQELQAMARRAAIGERIHFLGYLGERDRSNAYHAAEFLVIPSRQEAMSIVVLESGITGTPVLVTDQCGFNDVAEMAGGAVVPASVEGLVEGLQAMAGNTRQLQGMGQTLMEYVRKKFLWEHIARQHLELFASILGENPTC